MAERAYYKPTFGAFVKKRRGKHTQVEFAGIIGYHSSYISRMEMGQILPEKTLRIIAERLGDDPNIWLGEAGLLEEEIESGLKEVPLTTPSPMEQPFPQTGIIGDYGAITWNTDAPEWGEVRLFELEVVTDTLGPRFYRGERLGFKATKKPPKLGLLVAVENDGELKVVRYVSRTATGLRVCPANAVDLTHPTELRGARIVGVWEYHLPAL